MLIKTKKLASIIDRNKSIREIIQGIHVEGPFINPQLGYRGAHPERSVIPADLEKMRQLFDSGNGLVKLVTLAPEIDEKNNMIDFLVNNGVIVSAGHSNASMEDLKRSIEGGLKMFTHLGNGTPSILQRHDNIIERVLSYSDKLMIGFIADGIHIPDFALRNYIKVVGAQNTIIVTDAISAASAPPGDYSVSHIKVSVGKDRIVREYGKDNLAGSSITMWESKKFLSEKLNMEKTELEMVLSLNAKKLLSL
jgi:N-acetylglucosamine-6-phosphate deacetylase